jgi:hypothetical protein
MASRLATAGARASGDMRSVRHDGHVKLFSSRCVRMPAHEECDDASLQTAHHLPVLTSPSQGGQHSLILARLVHIQSSQYVPLQHGIVTASAMMFLHMGHLSSGGTACDHVCHAHGEAEAGRAIHIRHYHKPKSKCILKEPQKVPMGRRSRVLWR